ncbi:MAG: flagellin protein FlaA [Betaproteobacteria bacterium]|nr:flagellin protein FlaA [Betaproteobacteria bacterium]
MTIINTNVKALFAHQALKVNDRSMTDNMNQLSTGKRINSAKDDAAGLAIGVRMTADLRGISVAIRNANDGISMMQTAEGALGEISNMLQRMRELSVQAANGTMSRSNREALQAEMDQLVAEIDNVAETTNFNGIKLINGQNNPVMLQTGVKEGEQVQVGVVDARSKSLGLQGFAVEGEMTSGRVGSIASIDATDDVLINNKPAFASSVTVPVSNTNAAKVLASAINTNIGQHQVKVTAFNTLRGTTPTAESFAAGALKINSKDVGAAGSVAELVSNINRDVGGIIATLSQAGTIELSNNTGEDIVIGATSTAGFVSGTYTGYISMDSLTNEGIKLFARSDANGYPGGVGTVADLQRMGLNETSDGAAFTGVSVSSASIAVSDDIRINGVRIGTSADSSAIAKASTINLVAEQTGVKATALTEVQVSVNLNNVAAASMSINGAAIDTTTVLTLADLTSKINAAGVNGIIASASNSGVLILKSAGGADITVNDTSGTPMVTGASSLSGDTGSGTLGTGNPGLTVKGRITLYSDVSAAIRVEAETPAALAKIGIAAQGGTDVLVGGALTIVTQEAAGRALSSVDRALDQILVNRATLGAFQNRLTVAVDNLMTTSGALNQSRSRIMDADYAQISTELARNQIIQQAGTAILAQANTSQQSVLQLLQG